MARIRHLDRAPIKEAIVDFRVARSGPVDERRLLQAPPIHREVYPVLEERRGTETYFEISPSGPSNSQVKDLGLQGVWLKTPDQRMIAQFRGDGFTLNRLEPYTSWQHLLPEALRLWASYVALTNPDAVTRLALRYINRIPIPRGADLDNYMLTAPKLPQGVPEVINTFATRIVLHDPVRSLNANVVQALEVGPESESHVLLFDIDAYRATPTGLASAEVRDALDSLHDYKNEIFFGSLTEQLVAQFT